MATILDLAQKVKAKYPGQYDDLPDALLGAKIKAKFPGQYDDFADIQPSGLGMGDVQGVPSANPALAPPRTTANIPVAAMTGDPETDRRIADAARAAGQTQPITGKTALDLLLLSAGAAAPEVAGPVLGGALGGGLGTYATTKGGLEGLKQSVLPAALGAAGGYLLPRAVGMIPKAGKLLLRAITPSIQPTEEASRLLAQGVPLTTGQLNPASFVNTLEQASDRAALGMGPAREAAEEAWRNAALKQPLAPGQTLPSGGTAEKLVALKQGFGPQYDPIAATPVDPASLEKLPDEALNFGKGIDARTRQAAAGEIKNALTILPEDTSQATVGDLQAVRSNIRDQIRDAINDPTHLRALKHAESVLTNRMEQSLSPEAAQTLRDADARYRSFMTLSSAAARSGLAEEFTPKQLGAAIRAAQGTSSFSQGGGGDLRQLAQDANAVFSPTVQPTGMRASVTAAIPKSLVAPAARLANTPAVREAMLRAPLGPISPQVIAATGGPSSRAAALIAALRKTPGLAWADAQENEQ